MSFELKMQIALTVLLTGIVVVFVMLIFLTYIIKGYGAIVSSIEEKMGVNKKAQESPTPINFVSAKKPAALTEQYVQAGISDEVVAAISAAVYMMYGASASSVTSIRRASQSNRSAWGMAGMLENTRPF